MSIEYKTRTKEINTALEKVAVGFKEVAVRGFNLEQCYRIFYTAISRSPKLMICTSESLARCLVDAASLGLYIGSTLGQCYAVPFKNSRYKPPIDHEATFMLGYSGMCELVRRSGEVESITSDIVYERDFFEHRKGLSPLLNHVPYGYDLSQRAEAASGKLDRGKAVIGYCVTVFKGGGHHVETMTVDQINARRDRSKAKSDGPWVTDWYPMARKTLIRASFPFLPKTPEIIRAMALDDRVELPDVDSKMIPVEVDLTTGEIVDQEQSATEKLVDELAAQPKAEATIQPVEDTFVGPYETRTAADIPKDVQPSPVRRRSTKKAPTDSPEKEVVQPEAQPAAQEPFKLSDAPDEPPTKPEEIKVDLANAQKYVGDALRELSKQSANILEHQFCKANKVAYWQECKDVAILEGFYELIEEARAVGQGDGK